MTVQSKPTDESSRTTAANLRRDMILDAALSLFAEYGVEGTTMKMLAKRAGISPGLTYHYFKGKADLLDQVIESRGVNFPELATRHSESIEVVLPSFARELGADLRKNMDVIWIFFREFRSSQTVAQRIGRRRQACVASLAQYLEARQAVGEVRPLSATVASRSLLGSLFQIHLSEEPAESFIDELVDIFLQGIRS
jgi:TetR/AcrR family transcriptional regulator, cholesterol catabolism regulator